MTTEVAKRHGVTTSANDFETHPTVTPSPGCYSNGQAWMSAYVVSSVSLQVYLISPSHPLFQALKSL